MLYCSEYALGYSWAKSNQAIKTGLFVTSANQGATHPPSRGLFRIKDEWRGVCDVRVEVGRRAPPAPVCQPSCWLDHTRGPKRLSSRAGRPLSLCRSLAAPGHAASSAYREWVAAAGRRSSSTLKQLSYTSNSSLCTAACSYTEENFDVDSTTVTVLESFPCTTYNSSMSPLLYHVVHFTTGLHHTAIILLTLFIATFNTNSVQSFNSSCIRAVFPLRQLQTPSLT
jgi:hypothetical protein